MTKNQLFRKLPSKDFVIKILKIYDIDGFDLSKPFTIKELEKNDIINKLSTIQSELKTHYLKCKWKYIENLTPKKSVTLLRQLLKLYGYKLSSKEKCVKGDKFCIYQIVENTEDIIVTDELTHELKVSFD
jgi:hypothetical protein